MKTWVQIERMALRDNLRVRRHLRLGDDTVELWTRSNPDAARDGSAHGDGSHHR